MFICINPHHNTCGEPQATLDDAWQDYCDQTGEYDFDDVEFYSVETQPIKCELKHVIVTKDVIKEKR